MRTGRQLYGFVFVAMQRFCGFGCEPQDERVRILSIGWITEGLSRFWCGLQPNHPLRDSKPGETSDSMNVKFAHDVLPMSFHGAHADAQSLRNFFVAEPFSHAHKNLAFAAG